MRNNTRKAQLAQSGTRNSGACLKNQCEASNDVSFTLATGCQTARPVSLSRIGLKSQIFPHPLLFSALARGAAFEFMEKLYGS